MPRISSLNSSRYGASWWRGDEFFLEINPVGQELLSETNVKTGTKEADSLVDIFLKHVVATDEIGVQIEVHNWAHTLDTFPFPPNFYSAINAVLSALELPPMRE